MKCINGSLLRASGIQSYGWPRLETRESQLSRSPREAQILMITQSGLTSRGTGYPVILVCTAGFIQWNQRKWTDLDVRSCQYGEDWAGLQDSRALRDMRPGINNTLMSVPRLIWMTCKAAPAANVQWFSAVFSLCVDNVLSTRGSSLEERCLHPLGRTTVASNIWLGF